MLKAAPALEKQGVNPLEGWLTPVGPKRYGSAVGFEAKTAEGHRWLVKLGMDNGRGKPTSSIPSQSLARIGIEGDAMKELIGTDFYKVLPAMPSEHVILTATLAVRPCLILASP